MDRLALAMPRDGLERVRVPATRVTILNNMVTPYTNRLYNRLARRGVAISVVSCTRQEANRSWGETAPADYPHTVLSGRALKIAAGRYAHVNSGVAAALAKTRPDVLFINGFYPTMLKGAAWSLFTRTPLCLITEGWRETMPNTIVHRIVRPLVLARCRAVVTPGVNGTRYFRDAGIAARRIFTVPLVPAWDMPESVPPFSERPFHLLWCGHLKDAQKNVSFFLALVNALKPRLPDLRVRIVGNGELEAVVKARLAAAKVEYLHQQSVPWHQMAEVYASARVLVFPSVWDPWGLVCDEALQCGVPALVSSHVGAAADLIQPATNGHILPLDVETWVEHCLALATRAEDWSRLSAEARVLAAGRGLDRSETAFMTMLDRL